jgi:protein involved in polysaccharide export with SLBB domain
MNERPARRIYAGAMNSLRTVRRIAATFVFATTAAACATVSLPAVGPRAAPAPRAASLAVGDVIAVDAPRAPWLTGLYRVAPDGALTLPRVGRVRGAGRTLDELTTDLETRREMPERASVAVHTRLGRRVAVAGEVRRPGLIVLDAQPSLARVIAAVGGPTSRADAAGIEVLRARRRIRLSLEADRNFRLEPGDAVVVRTEGFFETHDAATDDDDDDPHAAPPDADLTTVEVTRAARGVSAGPARTGAGPRR